MVRKNIELTFNKENSKIEKKNSLKGNEKNNSQNDDIGIVFCYDIYHIVSDSY